MSDLLIAAVSFGLSQVLLGLALLLRQSPRGIRERLYGLLLVSVSGYLAMPLAQGTAFEGVAMLVQTAAPGMFYLFSASVFSDHFQVRRWQLGLVAFTVFMPLLGRLSSGQQSWLFFTVPQAVEFLLLGMALWVVSRYWRSDLVESRRRLRFWFVGLNGVYLLLLIFSREILFPGQAWLATWEYLPAAGLLLLINLSLLEYRNVLLFQAPAEVPRAVQEVRVDPALLQRLESHMVEHATWRQMGLTLGELASQLELPQYRLREAINRGLGYRNFSDFLNRYRLEEAASRLADPANVQLPVLTIAMDAGFRSLSSFNKAFKEARGMTPTAWRRERLGGAAEAKIP